MAKARYRENRKVCGDYMFVDLYPVFENGTYKTKTGKRKKRYKPTSEVQKRLNDKHSEERAVEIIHTNFSERDLVIHCTFRDGCEPENAEEALKVEKNFLRRLSYLYKSQGKELKYFAVGAEGEESLRKHFHIIVSGGVSREEIEKCWKVGYCNVDRLYFDECGIAALVGYVMKQIKIGKRRWRGSRNLKKPIEKAPRETLYRRQDVIEVCESPYSDLIFQYYPGYTMSKIEYMSNDFNGGIYARIMLYSDNAEFIKRNYGKAEYIKRDRYSLKYAQLRLGAFAMQ